MAGPAHLPRSALARARPTALAASASPPADGEKPRLEEYARRLGIGFGGTVVGGIGAIAAALGGSALDPIIDAGQSNPQYLEPNVLAAMRQDPGIALALKITKAPFSSIPWWFEGGRADIRAACNAGILPHIQTWLPVLLRPLDFGFQVSEIAWSVGRLRYSWPVARENSPPEIKTATIEGAYLPKKKLLDLDPATIQMRTDDRGRYIGVTTPDAAIPGDKTILGVQEQEFGSLLGRPLSLRAFQPWRKKLRNILDLAQYLHRKGEPPWIGEVPDEEITDRATGQKINIVDVFLACLTNIRNGSAVVVPREIDPATGQPKYAVRSLEVPDRAAEFEAAHKIHSAEILMGMLVPPSLIGSEGFAVAKVAERVFYSGLDDHKNELVIDPVNEQVVPRFVSANFGTVDQADIPVFCGGDPSENAKEIIAELIKAALALYTRGDEGPLQQVASKIDWDAGLDTLGVPRLDPALAPTPGEMAAVGASATPTGQAVAGRPTRIMPETGRPDAPSRPGLSRAIALAASPEAAAWWSGVESGLAEIDKVVWQTEALMESERQSVEAEIKNLARKAILGAKNEGGRLSTANRTLAGTLEKDVAAVIEESLLEDMLDESDLTRDAVALAKRKMSPLSRQHAAAAKAASRTAQAAGAKVPAAGAVLRGVRDVVRDANRNGRGVVIRESRRIAETVDRLIQAETLVADAQAAIDAYELPTREWVESTVHHVRASARTTLAQAGLDAGADSWVVTAGPATEREVVSRFPRGEVAEQLWTVKTTAELDAVARGKLTDGRPATSWRNLGLNFFSEEMYVPLPGKSGSAAFLAALAFAAERRRALNEERARRQAEIDGRSTPAA